VTDGREDIELRKEMFKFWVLQFLPGREHTVHVHYKDRPDNAYTEIFTVQCEKNKK